MTRRLTEAPAAGGLGTRLFARAYYNHAVELVGLIARITPPVTAEIPAVLEKPVVGASRSPYLNASVQYGNAPVLLLVTVAPTQRAAGLYTSVHTQ